jgi:A/G-specific adenine glycosylase
MTHRSTHQQPAVSPATDVPAALPPVDAQVLAETQRAVVGWYRAHARDLPWRESAATAWSILVCEVMSQQTPVVRVLPRWEAWMARWPRPSDLAAAPASEVLLAWDSLGYPRRALRLQETARAIAELHGDRVPDSEAALRALPGVGDYTAAAVTSFAHGQRTAVLDVNVRRVLARSLAGLEHRPSSVSRRERAWAEALVPAEDHVEWNAGLMELGALVCTSRSPSCEQCPLAQHCVWLAAGRPAHPTAARRTQAWAGTDRQLRGAIMRCLREASAAEQEGVPVRLLTAPLTELTDDEAEALAALPAPVHSAVMAVRNLDAGGERTARLVADLLSDGLAQRTDAALHLPH